MSIRVNVKKHYKNVLPKVKGHYWNVEYGEDAVLGNVHLYLWRRGFAGTIAGSAHAEVSPSDTFEQAQELVRAATEQAIQKALDKGVQFKWGKPVAPDNITGKSK